MRLISGCLHSTPVSWLLVLSNVAPPSVHCKTASDKMLQVIEAHPNWPVYADVFDHPPRRLTSRCPISSDMTPVDSTAQWREDWPSASVINYTTVTDPTLQQPGFDLNRQSWSLLNRFWIGQGPCQAILNKWGLAKSRTCDCSQQQTMSHIVDACLLTKLMADYNYFTKLKMTVKWLAGLLQVFKNNIPWLFQSITQHFPDLYRHKFQYWNCTI